MLMAAATLSLPMVMNAQTENPRGIYKMMTVTGRMGEVNAPWDSYKICTDSVTLMATIHNDRFWLSKNDKKIFNYTGPEPQDENDKSTLIYDSNAEHFTEKWWSEYKNHAIFPENDWCIEKYEANRYSSAGRPVMNILTTIPAIDSKNPVYGTWRIIGYVDELKDVRKQLKVMLESSGEKSRKVYLYAITSEYVFPMQIAGGECNGQLKVAEFHDRKTIKVNGTSLAVKQLSKDIIAMEIKRDYATDWQIMKRETGPETPLSRVASMNVSK